MAAEVVPKRKKSINIKDARIAGLYDLEQTIGQGHFAIVKRAKHVFTQEKVAVKIIDKDNLDPTSREHMMQEVRCMKLVQHPNIVRLYEVIDTQTKLFLILELGDHDMHDFILKYEKGCPELLAQQYFSQIIKAISYCHKLHVVHRDLKPENVVFFEQLGMVKLTDFGFSNNYEPGTQLKTSCGSLAYSAPEILLGDAYDAPAVDVWSLGVILYMLVVGRLPFQEANDSETLTKILDCRFSLPDSLSASCKSLINRMLIRDSSKRAGLSEISMHPWVAQGDRGHAEAIPLIERHHLPEDAHLTIIEQMVAGNIGTTEAILNAIENDDYNYMSATYFLLAERVLASCRFEKAKELVEVENLPPEDETFDSTTGLIQQQQSSSSTQRCRSRSNSWRATRRPCSILKEESEEELSTYYRSSSRHSSRNSSPAMSMFGGSARDRLSPQYAQGIQDLLEVIRPIRRAASPESVRSSRSPSPPGSSSGRTSPSVSNISLSRFKASCTIGGGMRKLSSSPHLLGICEEGEELLAEGAAAGGLPHGHHSLLNTNAHDLPGRTNRSASTGLVVVGPRHRLVSSKSIGQQPTYSAVRMIRPRQAVLSPDVLRRYEAATPPTVPPSSSTHPPLPTPRFFLDRSRRSTSCSSSEASDDEERNRSRLLIGSGRCTRGIEGRRRSNDDEDPGDGGVLGGASKFSTTTHAPGTATTTTSTSENTKGEQGRSNAKEACSTNQCCTVLHPIPELTHLDVESMQLPSRGISKQPRSATIERAISGWASSAEALLSENGSWLATPPRDPAPLPRQWVKTVYRSRSQEAIGSLRINIRHQRNLDGQRYDFNSPTLNTKFELFGSPDSRDSGQGSSSPESSPIRNSDAGAPSRKMVQGYQGTNSWKNDACDDKVDAWLRTAQFGVRMAI
ncbi:unnamed protein product, partial [Mesorhabditis belari]|uniref:SNF-related serine/threonine-protein kinase n=1 Tax=Mesorhabditis belari TaxID=2138241 RepID=A0AAF3FGJ7_9BILA